jgi:hypothetical protein
VRRPTITEEEIVETDQNEGAHEDAPTAQDDIALANEGAPENIHDDQEEVVFTNEGADGNAPLFTEHTLLTQATPKKPGAERLRTRGWTSDLSRAVSFLETTEHSKRAHGTKNGPIDTHKTVNEITHILMNQMTAKKGVKEYGDRAVKAIMKEYDQLDKKNAFEPRLVKTLTKEERARALRSITLIKEKRSGVIKGRTVADGRPQRKYKAPEDVHSPTVSTEGLMTTLAIDAKENRYVVTADVEGAYLHADMDELVIMVFEGDMVDYMVQTNPEKYAKYVHTTKSGKKLLYVQLIKALYGCIQSAMLWWKLLTSTLLEQGFEVNPYDPCVANKIMDDGPQDNDRDTSTFDISSSRTRLTKKRST